ncbi:thiamine pyrophosphate-binding protein [Streptomyces chartreusis]|uniref:thiamine pyrophosphate-binding protein n=1 Tax=Streptomyces chartreusis TaxID=1969 RepID=UPI003651FCE5
MKVHAALAATLTDHGVTTMFGLVGDGNVFFGDSFTYEEGGRYIAAAHEAGSILMAAGYAVASQSVGVATVTQGPGLANTLGTLYSAVRERAPIVLIVGDTSPVHRGSAQQADQSRMVAATGAIFEEVLSANTAPTDLARALRTAWQRRCPVVFNVPADINFAEIDYQRTQHSVFAAPQATAPEDAAMDTAVGLMASANRPLVLAGMGAVWSHAKEPLSRLADALGAPLATTLPAKGFFASDPRCIGVFGSLSTEPSVEAIQDADCIIAVGASLNEYTAGDRGYPYFKDKRIIQVDVDPGAFGRWYQVDAAVVADAVGFAEKALDWLKEIEHSPSGFQNTTAARMARPVAWSPTESDDFVDVNLAMDVLNEALPTGRAIVSDGGRFMGAPVKRLDVFAAERWSFPARGFGAIGNGLATAVGVATARPEAPTLAVLGDGGFMLGGITELNTVVRAGLDVVTVVCNDGSYGAEWEKLQLRNYDVRMSIHAWPDFAPVADALGATGFTVRNATDLDQMKKVIADRDRPVLIDLKIDPRAPRP